MRVVTAFEQQVYEAISAIPCGKVTTYKYLAQRLGCGSAQAVGQALKRNPHAPQVPCHRVINSQLKIAGYMGQVSGEEVQRKIDLLAAEGVEFDSDGYLEDCSLVLEEW
ncbi:MGMT family protein [Rubritalea tangerina]|uniref:MGMT family protein n=1 Tax=Rubritalea tangerina TaxID=430798 RepID=A0ABW4ZAB4_9BACT